VTERHVLSKANRSYKRLLDVVADQGELTLVVGAGSSMDAGLPGWSDLVRTFLESALQMAKRQGWISSPYDELTELILSQQDTLSAASMGRYLCGDQRDQRLKMALYDGQTLPPPTGRIGKAISDLALAFGSQLRIITTNYDDTIERQLLSTGRVQVNVQTVTEQGLESVKGVADGAVSIVHLHGYAPYEQEPVGPLVLDEKDYAMSKARPPGQVLPELLSGHGPVLFVGLSMTDPNLVAACNIAQLNLANKQSTPWFGLFVGEAENADLQSFIQQRLRQLGIQPIQLVSYGQISQVLYEILYRVVRREEYWSDSTDYRYGRRIEAWRTALMRTYRSAQGGDDFAHEHNRLHETLSSLVDTLQAEVFTEASSDENLAAHLWVRHPREESLGELELWGSSAHLHREAWSLKAQTIPIASGSEVPAVDSVFFASVQRRNRSPQSSRWQAIVAVPIELVDDPYPHLIVGSITLSSTMTMDKSAIPQHFDDIVRRLQQFGRQWLTPLSASNTQSTPGEGLARLIVETEPSRL